METLAWAAPVANSIRPAKATRKERILTFGLQALTAAPRLPVPPHNMPGVRLWFQWPLGQSLTCGGARTRRRRGFIGRAALFREPPPGAVASRIHHRRATF